MFPRWTASRAVVRSSPSHASTPEDDPSTPRAPTQPHSMPPVVRCHFRFPPLNLTLHHTHPSLAIAEAEDHRGRRRGHARRPQRRRIHGVAPDARDMRLRRGPTRVRHRRHHRRRPQAMPPADAVHTAGVLAAAPGPSEARRALLRRITVVPGRIRSHGCRARRRRGRRSHAIPTPTRAHGQRQTPRSSTRRERNDGVLQVTARRGRRTLVRLRRRRREGASRRHHSQGKKHSRRVFRFIARSFADFHPIRRVGSNLRWRFKDVQTRHHDVDETQGRAQETHRVHMR